MYRLSLCAMVHPPSCTSALLWSKIDEELEMVVAMCKERTERLEHLPSSIRRRDYQLDNPAPSPTLAAGGSEKMRLDLEAVAMAIDRLYLVAPQLHNQRVELKSSKLAQMEKARRQGPARRKIPTTRDLENMLELIGRASERTLKDQSVILDGGMKTRLERSSAARCGQEHGRHVDAGPSLFGKVSRMVCASKTPRPCFTLPEFVKEALPPHVNPSPPTAPASAIRKKPIRTRSMSAPSMSWLRRPSSRSGLRSEVAGSTSAAQSVSESEAAFSVTYIAEHHENLQHILVFLTVRAPRRAVDIEAEVLPAGGDAAARELGSGGDYLVHVRVQGAHYELKLAMAGAGAAPADTHAAPLLDATQLAHAAPTSFICASCSLPVVQDLPSEHWEELVDAWMCHADQKLNPRAYILFEEEAMVKHHLCPADETKRGEEWRLVRCICGAVVGRCQEHQGRYAIRPVSSATEPSKLPLSAFIVEDMTEFVDAHVSYRFIILDEEEERARILVWLFKPHMRLAYTTQTQYALPRSASIRTAKVLYKLLGPSEGGGGLPRCHLEHVPRVFRRREYLFLPMDICRRLAGLLKESNGAYPESLRTMTGLESGWLRRA
ncbi:HECT-like ubiquitin-conjugating enzyme-binding-domain-containing protein [Mycena olivaceomarginata]|nr:HECT-like ubiquitin-conjugating enzyme-binding-domain-containing protein [Mycena olivaceomarginata]